MVNDHNRRRRIMEYCRTPSDQDFTRSRDNLGPSPGSLVIRIKLKCLSQPVRTEIKRVRQAISRPVKVKKNQVMVDGSRRLSRQNVRYLRLFTPFQPNMVLSCRSAAMKTTEPAPSASRNIRQPAPVEVQRRHDQKHDVPVEVHRHQSQQQPAVPQKEEHGGYVYKPLGE